eukprot:scaffold16758_cov57-Attheya_sp.AAC.6
MFVFGPDGLHRVFFRDMAHDNVGGPVPQILKAHLGSHMPLRRRSIVLINRTYSFPCIPTCSLL